MLSVGLLYEISNPVNLCLMAITVAQKDPAVEDSLMLFERLNDTKEGTQRVQRIVLDLKTFAYRNPGKGETNAPLLTEKTIDSTTHLTSHELRGVAFERKPPADTPVRDDEIAITGVLINLPPNAMFAL